MKTAPILYSFRRCPYAMRARMALVTSGQRVELREVVLKDKPTAMLEASPKGTVPVLIFPDGHVLDESLNIMLYALGVSDPEGWLTPETDNLDNILALIHLSDTEFKFHLDRYKYSARYDGVDAARHRQAASEFLLALNSRLAEKGAYLFGSKPCLADYAIMPFVRQFSGVERAWFEAEPWPYLHAWLKGLMNEAPFVRIMKKYIQWQSDDIPIYFP